MLNIQEALYFVISRASLPETESTRLLSDLALFSGTNPLGQTVYRPYYLTAREIWLSSDNNVKVAEGATFDQNFEVCRRYASMQYMLDNQQQLTVPPDYSSAFLLGFINQTPEHIADNPNIAVPIGFMSF